MASYADDLNWSRQQARVPAMFDMDMSFAARQPLSDTDESMPGLASSESSSEDENNEAFALRPWFAPEE